VKTDSFGSVAKEEKRAK